MGSIAAQEWLAITLSIKVAVIATMINLPIAVWVAHILARGEFRGKQLLNALVHMPLILPPVVTGYLLLLTFGTQGTLGSFLAQFNIIFAFRWTGAVLAAGIMAFPLMVRAIRIGIEAVDPKLEQAATTLGASRWCVFRTVTLPLILPSIIAGVILCFAKALGEFGATITFVAAIPGETQTIASAIYAFLQVPDGDTAAIRLTLISVFIALAALLLSEMLAQRAARRLRSRAQD